MHKIIHLRMTLVSPAYMKHTLMRFPKWREFLIYLESECDIKVDSGIKSRFTYITTYFKRRSFTRLLFREMLHELKNGDKHLKTQSINKYIRTATLLAYYVHSDELKDYPTFHKEKAESYGEFITDKEMAAIADCYIKRRCEKKTHIRYKSAFTLMRFSGIPPDDLVNLTWDSDKGTHFEVYRGKTYKSRNIPIVQKLRILLDKMQRYPHNYVFGSARGRLSKNTLREELKIRCDHLGYTKRITPYSFRYSFVTLCWINGGEGTMGQISKIAGHSIDTAMKHYEKFNVQNLIDALEASHPGLKRSASIDVIKRVAIEFIKKLVDMSKYNIYLEIMPKDKDTREVYLS